MKHIFIINPNAGVKDVSDYLIKQIKDKLHPEQYDIHITSGVLDAKEYAYNYCLKHPDSHKRFYSCGGDGTLNEVLNGIYGFDNVSLACYPAGSGNDFVKNFGDVEDFCSLDNLIDGSLKPVDIIKFNGLYALNICNLGFDGDVAYNFVKFKNKLKLNGKAAYNLAVIYSLFSKTKHQVEIYTEDGLLFKGPILLAAIANGKCYGGQFYCAPQAIVDDGIIDLVVVKKISRFWLLKFIKYYRDGKHLEHPKLQDDIIFTKCQQVNFKSKKKLSLSYDGEILRTSELNFQILSKAIDFVVPRHLI